MALSRNEKFPEKDLTLAAWCKAISHPARIAILRTLAKSGECICGDLVLDLPLAQSTVSQHLKALKEAKLIKGEIDGPRTKYCIDTKNYKKFMNAMAELESKISDKLKDQNC